MLSLFDDIPIGPPGFVYAPGFLTEKEEQGLLQQISGIEMRNMMFHGYTAKRKTANFGWDWSFENRVLTKGKEIPKIFDPLIAKAADHFNIDPITVAELLVTEYPPGAVINPHRDAPPYDKIIGISLLSDCIFRFRPYQKANRSRKSTISFPVSRRSAYMMENEARAGWEHSIEPLSRARYSITLRTLR